MDEQEIQDEKPLHREMTHSIIRYRFGVIHQPGSDLGGILDVEICSPFPTFGGTLLSLLQPLVVNSFFLCGQCSVVSNQGEAISNRSFSPCSGLEFGAEIPSNLPT